MQQPFYQLKQKKCQCNYKTIDYIYGMEIKDRGYRTFFKYLLISFIFSSLRYDITKMSEMEIIEVIFKAYLFNIFIGIPFGVFSMIGEQLFLYLKKIK